MAVNWYPGHMHKASKELKDLLERSQVFLEILDARCPRASSNPLHAGTHRDMPSIRLLNKCDLAEEDVTASWQRYFDNSTTSSCLLSSKEAPIPVAKVLAVADRMLRAANVATRAFQQKLIVIAGIPNVGKSSLLNAWCGRKLARTGNEPAITRSQQRVPLQDDWYLVDTPGLLWPRLEDQNAACLLAAFGSIRQTAIDEEEIAWRVAERLLASHYNLLATRYQLQEPPGTTEEFFAAVARLRGAQRHGKPDMKKLAEILLSDIRSGRLGRISAEQVPVSPEPD